MTSHACNRRTIPLHSSRQPPRAVVGSTAAARALPDACSCAPRKVVVAAHPWVYAATMPNYDITPALDQIFADMKYAGMEAIELMHTALLPDDAVQRIGELSQKHELPVLGTSYGADMWDRQQHGKILEGAEIIITRLAQLGGRTLGTSVGAAPAQEDREQLDAQADVLRKIIALCAGPQRGAEPAQPHLRSRRRPARSEGDARTQSPM